MLNKSLLILAVLCAAILVGCSKSETSNNSNSSVGNSNKATTTSGTTTTTTASGDKIGIPECDEFIAKYDACAGKVPEIARAQYKDAGARWRAEWKKLADNPESRGTLAAACKQTLEQQTAAWKAYGCGE